MEKFDLLTDNAVTPACADTGNTYSCYACKTCVSVCPINIGSGKIRLQPAVIVRMANMGMHDQVMRLPELWYCLSCDRCSTLCPMNVNPSQLISSLRKEAFGRGIIGKDSMHRLESLVYRFPRVLWHAAYLCIKGEDPASIAEDFDHWIDQPVIHNRDPLLVQKATSGTPNFRNEAEDYFGLSSSLLSCLTCSECSNACPISSLRKAFDPLFIFRMAALGMENELLSSPSLWICLSCQSCTSACRQGVKGHLLIEKLKYLAVSKGILEKGFLERWRGIRARLYDRLLEKADHITGLGT